MEMEGNMETELKEIAVVMLIGFKGLWTGPCGNFLYQQCQVFGF
jgi:hypothetical protein